MITAKIRVTTSTNLDVCFLLPRFSPIKEAICLVFPDLMFFLCFCVNSEMSLRMQILFEEKIMARHWHLGQKDDNDTNQ